MNEKDLYKKTLFKSPIAFAFHEAIFDGDGNMIDYMYLDVNPAFEDATGLKAKDITGKQFRKDIIKNKEEGLRWVKLFEEVVKQQKEVVREEYSLEFKSQFLLHAFPVGSDKFVTLFRDTSVEYKMEQITSYFLDHVGKQIDFPLLAEMGRELAGADYAVFNMYDDATQTFTSKVMVSKQNDHDELLDFLGIKIENKKWKQSLKKEEFTKNYDIFDFPDLAGYTGSALTREMLLEAAEKLGIGKTVSTIIKTNNAILGNFVFIFKKGHNFFNTSYLNIYLKQLGVFIEKYELEKRLFQQRLQAEIMADKLKKDTLTNAYNRSVLNSILTERLINDAKEGISSYIAFIDIDNFKQINDTYGHLIGDSTLRMFVEKVDSLLRESDLLIRVGGDEFLIYLHDVPSNEEATLIMERLFATLTEPFIVQNEEGNTLELRIKLSAGLSNFPSDGISIKVLMHKADYTMYKIKRTGKNGFDFYQEND